LPVIHCSIASQGLANVIDIEWLQTFSYRELQVFVSGAYTPVDLEDLKQHTHYSGGYFSTHPVIQGFWNGRSSVSGKPSRASCTIRAAVCIFFLVLSHKNSLPFKNKKNKKYLKEEIETYWESRLK
jgi:hypothetical protein